MRKVKKGLNLWRLVLAQSKFLYIGLAGMFIAALLNLVTPIVMKFIIDDALPNKDLKLLLLSIFGLVVIPIVSSGFQTCANLVNHKVGAYITDYLRFHLFQKLSRLSPRTYQNFRSGDISMRAYACGEIGDLLITQVMVPLVFHILMIVGILSFMFYLQFHLAAVSLILLPIIYFIGQYFGKKTASTAKEVMQHQSDLTSFSSEFLAGLKTTQLYHQEKRELEEKKKWIENYRKIRNKTFVLSSSSELLGQLLRSLGFGIVFSYGAWLIFEGELTIGSLLVFTVYFPQLYLTIEKVQFSYLKIVEYTPKISLLKEILDLPDENQEGDRKLESSHTATIEMKNVSFSYEGKRGNLHNVSLTIPTGKFIGIVGPSGGGKSTILDLITRMYKADEGVVTLSGVDIEKYQLSDIRNHITLVSQDVFIWNRSILDNLLYANPNATLQEVEKACEIAQILEFIQSLPQGFETVVGERGVKLSGGEKQRLGIARTILRDSKILLMDEPTSALDAQTEANLMEALQTFRDNKTIIVVAHRLSTIQNADKIIVVQNGSVVEEGDHHQLAQIKGGVYSQLLQNQNLEV